MEEVSGFLFRNRNIFVIEQTSFWFSCWVWRCLLMDQVLWQHLRWVLGEEEMGNETTVIDTATSVTYQILAVIRVCLWSILFWCCSAPLMFLITQFVVCVCCYCEAICFVYIWCVRTGLCGKGEGFPLCSPPVGGFPIAERRREG